MVESVDTRDLKSLGVRAVRVQVPLRVPWEKQNNQSNKQCRETTYGWFFLCLKFASRLSGNRLWASFHGREFIVYCAETERVFCILISSLAIRSEATSC